MEKPFNSLSIAEIQRLNRESIERFGGFSSEEVGNFHNRASLEYVFEAILFPVFGEELYPKNWIR